jgi:transposase-like protein
MVQEIESGQLSRQQAMDKYNIVDSATLRSWVLHYAKNPPSILGSRPTAISKRQAVYRIINGEATVVDIATEMSVSLSAVFKWVKDIRVQINDKVTSATPIQSEVEIESLRLKIAALETMIDIAEKELKIDIRKKSGTKQ